MNADVTTVHTHWSGRALGRWSGQRGFTGYRWSALISFEAAVFRWTFS